MLLSAVNLYNCKIELLSIEVKLFRWTTTSSRRAEYNLTTDVIAINVYITKTLIDKSQFKEQFTKIFMLIKTPDDCRFDFFRDVICRLLSGILSRGVEPYCNTRCRFGLTEIYDTTCWFSDRPKVCCGWNLCIFVFTHQISGCNWCFRK